MITATPLPNTSFANTPSGTSDKGTTFPFNGLPIIIFPASSFLTAFFFISSMFFVFLLQEYQI